MRDYKEKSMINEKCKEEVREFLMQHSTPAIRVATTMRDGYVACIYPVKTICGAELMCSPNTKRYLMELTRAA